MKERNLTNRTVWSREVLKGSLEGLIIALLLFRLLFNVVVVSGPSMVPTLADNSVILTNHIKPYLEFESIVVCNSSGLDENIVKRIIGCPGDTIDIDFEQGVVYRNGIALSEPYTNTPTNIEYDDGISFPLTVEEDYYRIIYSKTASLFEAAFVSAAISVNAPADWIEAVRDYAVSLGIAFQIKDDIFDYSDGKKIGKPVGIDLEEQKITLPLLGALAAASPERAKQIRGMVLDILEHPEYKEEIVGFVKEGKGIEYAVSRLEDYVSKAVDALAVLPDSKEKDYLVKIAGFTAYRDK